MIIYDTDKFATPCSQDHAIWFNNEGRAKLITVFERALNTLSPMDPELLKVLEDMKEVK